jgi:hypothetical protein
MKHPITGSVPPLTKPLMVDPSGNHVGIHEFHSDCMMWSATIPICQLVGFRAHPDFDYVTGTIRQSRPHGVPSMLMAQKGQRK